MDHPNVVWITLDSVRADHTTMGGYSRDTTPALQRLADEEEGSYFGQCLSHGRYTMVSSASMLTGTYPSHHRAGYESQAIPSSLRTVGERLRAASYHTGLLSDNLFLSSATGLDRGFDRSACLVPSTLRSLPSKLLKTVGPTTALNYLLGLTRHSAGFTTDLTQHSRTYLINAVARDWLSSFANEEPFFLYVHNDQTHRPYSPPLPYRDEFTDDIELSPSDAAEVSLRIHETLLETIADGCDLTDQEWDALLAMYDAGIRYADEGIRALIEFIRDGPFGETVFVITADHGEFFGEIGLLGHKFALHDAVLNVPLVTHGLDVDTQGPVQHVDVMTTLLEMAGADTDGMQGVDLRSTEREYAIAQDHSLSTDEILAHNPDADVSHFPTDARSVIHDGEYKLRVEENSRGLYQLPDEATDVSSRCPDVADELERQLTEWLETTGQPADGDAQDEFSDDQKQHLADLGYLDEDLPD